jgi:hypothetical protein
VAVALFSGWAPAGKKPEYTAFGFPFDHRAARLEEALAVLVPLLRDGHVDFAGRYFSARDCVLRPRGPSRSGPVIWIGAKGPRTMRLVATYADAWNTVWHAHPEEVSAGTPRRAEARAAVGRDHATIDLTAGSVTHLRAPGELPGSVRTSSTGSPEAMAAAIRAFEDVGVRHLVLNLEPCERASIERHGPVIDLLRAG